MQILEYGQDHKRTLLFFFPARQSQCGPLPTRSHSYLKAGAFFR